MITEMSLSAVFNESAASLYKAFPERLDKLVVLVMPLEQPVYISPDIAEHLSGNVAAVKEAVAEITDYLRRHNMHGVADLHYALAKKTVKIIGLTKSSSNACSARYTEEMDAVTTFDHEIGHLVVKNGFSDNYHLAECAADAYAALRHVQRYGMDTDFLEYYDRSYNVIQELIPIHYTNAVLQKALRLAEERDISRLSLRETAELAATIAKECRLYKKTLEKLSGAFRSARDVFEKSGWNERVLRECVKVMRENKDDPDVYRAGKSVLSDPVLKKIINKMNPFWQDAFEWMARHEKESGIVLAAPPSAFVVKRL